MAKDTIKYWKPRAWKEFSLYIRTKDSTNGYNFCFTCDKLYPISKLQAGHLIDGRNNGVLFEERGVKCQCFACNVFLHGNKIIYYQKFEKLYGRDLIDELIAQSHTSPVMKWFDYKELFEKYKQLNKG